MAHISTKSVVPQGKSSLLSSSVSSPSSVQAISPPKTTTADPFVRIADESCPSPFGLPPGGRVGNLHAGLPTPSMQNHMHELAKTLPPPRRQNIACDACRARKVRCQQLPGQDKCQHCLSKNYPCTHFVQQATSEKKRSSGANRRPRGLSSAVATSPSASGSSPKSSPPADPHAFAANSSSTSGGSIRPYGTHYALTLPYQLPNSRASPQSATVQLLAYLFSPEGPTDPATFTASSRGRTPTYNDWGEISSKLESDSFRIEFALDLVEVFFQICHTRLPLLNPQQFRSRLKLALAPTPSPSASKDREREKYLHPALLATVIAWGAKFSEHPLLVSDREGAGGQSRVAKMLVNRAREVAEAEKVHRISSIDHVVIALLIEPLQSQNPDDPDGFHGFWLTCSIRHLLDLQINHKSVMSTIQDPEARGTMIFAWWMACLADAYHSAYYRRKPQLDDDDYDIDFYTVEPITNEMDGGQSSLSPREQYEFLGYYRAAHALARIARHMSKQLWRPSTESDGIPFDVLCGVVSSLNDWRDEHLPRVGVPSDFESEWDFVSAVSACASDATYHVMWVILFNAVDDFGVREVNEQARMGTAMQGMSGSSAQFDQIESLKHKLLDESLHGALRIAGLTGVLTSNGYLKLDPAVMHFSCLTAGSLLARLGRPEVSNCIGGLKQYSYAYDEAGEEAVEMERVYQAALAGEADVNHMATVVLPPPSGGQGQGQGSPTPMTIDTTFGGSASVGTQIGHERRGSSYTSHTTLNYRR